MDGFFCGNIGVVRTYLGELVDSSNEAKAFGILAATFSLGLIIGPTLGGSLAYPARWYPATFQGTIFDTHPFLLPNLSYACLAIAALLVGFFALPESRARLQQQQAALLEARSGGAESESQAVKFWQGFPKGRNFRQILIASSLLNGYVAARLNAFVLVSSLPQTMGGMALSPHQFGYIQVCAAAMIFLNQVTGWWSWYLSLFIIIYLSDIYCHPWKWDENPNDLHMLEGWNHLSEATFYPILMRRFGMHRCFGLCLSWTIAISLPIPVYYMVADPRFHFWRYVPITAWQMLSQFGLATCFPVAVMLVNRHPAAFIDSYWFIWRSSLNWAPSELLFEQFLSHHVDPCWSDSSEENALWKIVEVSMAGATRWMRCPGAWDRHWLEASSAWDATWKAAAFGWVDTSPSMSTWSPQLNLGQNGSDPQKFQQFHCHLTSHERNGLWTLAK